MIKTHKIELINRSHFTIEVPEDRYILDAVEQAGMLLPVGCRYGACITCAAKLIRGKVDQSAAICLKEEQIGMGYVLLCVAYPREDCQFEVGTECQDALYLNPFKG